MSANTGISAPVLPFRDRNKLFFRSRVQLCLTKPALEGQLYTILLKNIVSVKQKCYLLLLFFRQNHIFLNQHLV